VNRVENNRRATKAAGKRIIYFAIFDQMSQRIYSADSAGSAGIAVIAESAESAGSAGSENAERIPVPTNSRRYLMYFSSITPPGVLG
jgi:hypothetical protein